MIKFELNRSLSEIKLITGLPSTEGQFLPSQKLSIGEKFPVIFPDHISIMAWDSITGNSNQLLNFIDLSDDMFVKNEFHRCIIPIDGYLMNGTFQSHFFERERSLFYALALSNNENQFDFVMTENTHQLFAPIYPITPILLTKDDFCIWFSDFWKNILTERHSFVNLDFMQVIQNQTENSEGPSHIHQFDETRKARKNLKKMLSKITPNINDIINQ
ncbi:hypothetical protein TRFO_35943 [Tritrichomonas foetus]|uniref:Uncharacterized protein n=1 Tax=Tritrichomonas foetus TaxID=1144522 RepID=A0A1J4JHP3_9EUKA|nr:hypothetical protein TRFO_35943 [Tritrichomonas foetus]|eukprot:OHS97767.1 hypothetical protein TRFO_35943 [Tritrichomonas foetus]